LVFTRKGANEESSNKGGERNPPGRKDLPEARLDERGTYTRVYKGYMRPTLEKKRKILISQGHPY